MLPRNGSEAERLEAWVRSSLDATAKRTSRVRVSPSARAPSGVALESTAIFMVEAGESLSAVRDALPFAREKVGLSSKDAATDGTEAVRLERWVEAALASRAHRGWTMPMPREHDARVRPPDPIASAATSAEVQAPRSEPRPPTRERSFVPLPMAVYARIRLAAWHAGDDLTTMLERHGIDEIRWRTHELWLREALAASARERDSRLALELSRSLREARLEAAPPCARADEGLDRYAHLRARVELAGEEEEDAVLCEEGVARHDWDELRVSWAVRLRQDATLAAEVRKAIARARRALGATRGPADASA